MEYEEAIKTLTEKAIAIKKDRDKVYRSKWKEVEIQTLENFAQAKLARFVATKNMEDLIDVFNYLVFLYARLT